MKIFKQLIILFILSLLSQAIAVFFKLPIPASVIGMIILFLLLQLKLLKVDSIGTVSEFFINNLGILFIPSAVAIISKFHLIKNIWISFFALAIFSTIISLIITVKVVDVIKRKFEKENK